MITFLIVLMIAVVAITLYLTSNANPFQEDDTIAENLYEKPSQLKFKTTWFSDDYVTPYFYHNGWKPLLCVDKPNVMNDHEYTIKNITYRLGNGNFEYEKKRWNNVGTCLENNQRVWEDVKKLRKQKQIDDQKEYMRKQEAYKRANS